jgi:hypothetical protein
LTTNCPRAISKVLLFRVCWTVLTILVLSRTLFVGGVK